MVIVSKVDAAVGAALGSSIFVHSEVNEIMSSQSEDTASILASVVDSVINDSTTISIVLIYHSGSDGVVVCESHGGSRGSSAKGISTGEVLARVGHIRNLTDVLLDPGVVLSVTCTKAERAFGRN